MATTSKHILQHPSHPHPLERKQNLSDETTQLGCHLCHRKIWSKAYYSYYNTCREGCESYYHRACVEAPLRIDRHPLHHPGHPLTLRTCRPNFICNACQENFESGGSSFTCHDCAFDLDMCCALSSLSGGGGKTPEQITLPLHPHTLTSFSTRHEFIGNSDCSFCGGSVEWENGYACLHVECEFVIHRRCIPDLKYADGTKAPRVYHRHPMEIYVREDTTCLSCGSNKSGEFIGCSCCRVFYHRQCFQVPVIITYTYTSSGPDHTITLVPDIGSQRDCESCSNSLKDQIYYRCGSRDLLVHVGCALRVVDYLQEGMRAKIKLSLHKHPLFLCHRTESAWNRCHYCWDVSIGPTYVCEEKDCGFLLHKRCTYMESTITHPHHPDHPLSLCGRDEDGCLYTCIACHRSIDGLKFSCHGCFVHLHVECAALLPNHKHYLHEHKLLRLEGQKYFGCNRCGRSTDSPIFRCIPCNFNLHEECLELPRVVKSKIHWHPLTLQSTFLEDDSGEYYCEECEQTRDPRLGVYVCGQCEISIPRIYHIHCALPELAKVYEKDYSMEKLVSVVGKLNDRIADKKTEVRALKDKLEKATRELDELVEQRTRLFKGNIKWETQRGET